MDPGRASDPRPAGKGGAPPGANGPAAPAGDCSGVAGAVPWRTTVLTRGQYINTVSDLLGFDVGPLVKFDESGGRRFVAGVSMSALEVERRLITAEAIAAAAALPARWPGFVPCDPGKGGESACADQFIAQFGLRAFRAPLSPGAAAALRQLFDAGRTAGGFATGVEWVVTGVLQAPDFLYQLWVSPGAAAPGSVARLGGAALASRLAFFLWNSGPDLALLTEAGNGTLAEPAALGGKIEAMLADPRAARMRADYYGGWLELSRLEGLVREVPEFTPGLASDLRRSVIAGVEQLYQGDAQVTSLWGSPSLVVNAAMAKLYGLPALDPAADFAPVMANPLQRHGLLTHPGLLTLLGHPDASDPIARGVFVEEQVLCRTLPDPIADIPELPPLRAGLSTRQRLEQHRSQPACAACHQLFDPVGMALENYDAVGRYRTDDHGVAVDSSGEIQQGIDLDGKFNNGMDLLARIGASATVRNCMVQRWFEYAVRRELEPADQCAVAAVQQRFATRGDLRDLLAEVAKSDSFQSVLIEERATP